MPEEISGITPVGPGNRGWALVPSERAPYRRARPALPVRSHRLHVRVADRGTGAADARLGRAGRRSRGNARSDGRGGGAHRAAGGREDGPRRLRAWLRRGRGCVFGPAWADVDRN